MKACSLPSRRAIVLMAAAAAGLFLAGFGYGYAMPSWSPPFADAGPRVPGDGHSPENF